MKKLLIIAAVCISGIASAQSNSEDVDFVQSIYGKEKKMIMAEFVQVDDAKKDAFWTLYDEYEGKRKALGKERIALLEKYADGYLDMDDAAASEIINETISLGAKTDKLIATYFKKMNKAAGTKPAAQFYQLEIFLLSEVRAAILESIPFIGELD